MTADMRYGASVNLHTIGMENRVAQLRRYRRLEGEEATCVGHCSYLRAMTLMSTGHPHPSLGQAQAEST